jgi:tRNA threonylcarbamoyladenosine biosynthesis protein TsaB
MRVLALETSTLAGGIALVDGERTVGEYVLNVRITHSERLMPAVDRVLTDAGWTARDLEGLAVAIGPGSFTGLRIGLSVAKGLAFALRIPVAAVPTLDAMAAAFPFARYPVCPVVDARRDEVYCSLYRWNDARMHREWDYLALSPEALAARLREPAVIVGDPVASIPSPFARRLPPEGRAQSVVAVAHLGRQRLAVGETVAPADLVPLYLRRPEAELRRRAIAVP